MWLIIRIVCGKSPGVEDTREIPKKLGKDGKIANGKVLENGEVSAGNGANHGNAEIYLPF